MAIIFCFFPGPEFLACIVMVIYCEGILLVLKIDTTYLS